MTLSRNIEVVLADDHTMVRESLARVLSASGVITVKGQAGDGRELLEVMAHATPDCLIMDYSMPNHDPIETIKELLGRSCTLKILILTVHENAHYAVRVLQAGAHGYLIKSAAVDELVDAIRTVCQGDVYISKKISPEVWIQIRQPKRKRDGLQSLSQREFEVLRILGSGSSLQDCAKSMDVSVSTVSTYRARILEKLKLSSTNELVRFAIENKIIQ